MAEPHRPTSQAKSEIPAWTSRTRRIGVREAELVWDEGAGQRRALWSLGEGDLVAAGAAAVLTAEGTGAVADLRSASARIFSRLMIEREPDVPVGLGPRWVGAFAFDMAARTSGGWAGFPQSWFILPERQAVRLGSDWFLTETCADALPAGQRPTVRGPTAPPPAASFDASTWGKAVGEVLKGIHGGELSKVVLARSERVATPLAIDEIARRLSRADASLHRFLLEPSANHAFFGASPEPLVEREGPKVRTAAVAASTAVGRDAAADRDLAERLLEDPKEALEHEFVVGHLREALAEGGVRDLRQGPRTVRRLTNVQHLQTRIEGVASEGVHVLDLVARLHPSPAVAGVPTARALETIRRLELEPRGWYAGPVGWFDAQGNGAFAVGIRSGLATPSETRLYAGAGIVAGSKPEPEWRETDLKLGFLRDLLAGPEKSLRR